MKNICIRFAVVFAVVLSGCGHMPQTAEEFRKAIPGAFMGKVESFEANRPFSEVAKTFQKKAPECLNVRIKTTETSRTSHSVVVTAYKPTVVITKGRAELHVQMKFERGVVNVYKVPKDGHYLVVTDAYPLDKNRTKIEMFRPSMGHDSLIRAIKGWATGQNLGCPDLTK